MSRYPYIDRNPCIAAAGKPIGDPHENVKNLLQEVKLEDKIDALKRQFGLLETKDVCVEWLKSPDLDTSGAFTEIRHCLRNSEPTHTQALDNEIKSTIYNSYWNAALGKSRDQTMGFPIGTKPEEMTFGKAMQRSEPAGLVVNPRKPAELVEEEEKNFHDLYAFSHGNHYSGEQIKRNYAPPFSEYKFYGKSSNKDESGQRVKRCLTWFNNDPISNVSRRQAAVRNRTLPPLGKSLDKTGVTDLFPTNHIYGAPTAASFYGVEDLLNECPPSLVRRDMLTFLGYANYLRQSIWKKINRGEIALEELFDEMLSLKNDENDKGDCSVHFDCIERIMRRHEIFLDRNKLEPLLLMLGLLKQNNQIKVRDFINFIDKNSNFPELKKEDYILPPEFQNCSKDYVTEKENYREIDISSMPRAGVPTYRWNTCKPVYQDCIVNMDHLSQETTARAIISPSIYTQYGLSHRDFFKPRNQQFLGNLFRKIGVDLTDEDVEEIYQKGYELDQTGGVCVETFRNLLDELAYKTYKRL